MSTPPATEWTLERFRAMVLDERGPDAVAVLEDGLAWAERHGGKFEFGEGPKWGPIRFVVPDRAGQPVKALSLNTAEAVGVQYIYLKRKPPFDKEDELRDLTYRLNTVFFLVACGLPFPGLIAPTLRCPRNRVNSICPA